MLLLRKAYISLVAVGPMPGGTRLFVGNLPPDVTDDQLQYVLPWAVGQHELPDQAGFCIERAAISACREALLRSSKHMATCSRPSPIKENVTRMYSNLVAITGFDRLNLLFSRFFSLVRGDAPCACVAATAM